MHIDADTFARYEAVRRSGITNMLDIRRVASAGDLEQDQVLEIIKNYSALKDDLSKYLSESDINEAAEDIRGMYQE